MWVSMERQSAHIGYEWFEMAYQSSLFYFENGSPEHVAAIDSMLTGIEGGDHLDPNLLGEVFENSDSDLLRERAAIARINYFENMLSHVTDPSEKYGYIADMISDDAELKMVLLSSEDTPSELIDLISVEEGQMPIHSSTLGQ